MPDFLCYRRGALKFVASKFKHEQLSDRQKKCITRLQKLGFEVEVHKLVNHSTKLRVAEIDMYTGEKTIVEKQLTITRKPKPLSMNFI